MLHTVNQNDLVVVEDLIDDAIIATSRRPQTLKFSNQRLSEPTRVVRNRPEDGFQCSVPHLLRELVEMAKTLSRDLDRVHPTTSDVIRETNPLALLGVSARTTNRLHELIVFEDVQGFLKRLEVVGAQKDERRPPVSGDEDAVVLTLDPIGQFR
jgi:hypothetical protein